MLLAVLTILKRITAHLESAGHQSSGTGGQPRGRPMPEADEMVQDPHCKVYVPLTRAVTVRAGADTLHFCSEDCARKYVSGMGGSLEKRA